MTDKQLAVRESDIHAAYGRARLNWEREGGDLVALITRELNALLAAAPAAPTEGARDQSELASITRMFHDACSDLGLINEELGLDPDEGGAQPILDAIRELKGQRDNFADDAYALAAEGARDAGVGTAAAPRAWLVEWKIGADIWVAAHASEVPAVDQARKNSGTCTPLYARPDPLLVEAITALRWLYDVAVVKHDEDYAAVTNAAAVLHKVHVAREQQS